MKQLRGSTPKPSDTRLKLLLVGEAKVGKTRAALQMRNCYVIDTEAGTSHYADLVKKSKGAVFQTANFDEVLDEVRRLSALKHAYKTLIIDSFTPIYDDLLDQGSRIVGEDFGKHYGYANRQVKRLYNLLSQIDTNVIVTCHAKNLYGNKMEVIGTTFDGWKKLDYLFDLILFLERDQKGQRIAHVRGTRLAEFPDQSRFEWSYANLVEKYGKTRLERKVNPVELASPEIVTRFKRLYNSLAADEISLLKIDKVISSADEIPDLPESRLLKGIEVIEAHQMRDFHALEGHTQNGRS